MRLLLKILREGSGRILIFLDWLIKPSITQRSPENQLIVDKRTELLKLYEFYAWPFCSKTRRAI